MATACRCRKCEWITKHRPVWESDDASLFQCEACGTQRRYAKKFGAGDFPELNYDENETIHEARACGFGSSFPAYPDGESQARSTLRAAREWLETHSITDA